MKDGKPDQRTVEKRGELARRIGVFTAGFEGQLPK
jgi:hypothetical protein